MFTKWLLLRLLEQGRSVPELARTAGVCEMEIQKLLTSGDCGRYIHEQLEKTLTAPGLQGGGDSA